MAAKHAPKPSDEGVNIFINDNSRKRLAEELSAILANNVVLYMKTQAVHWNVTGPTFKAIHDLTEAQYQEFAEANDEIAERIRALGYFAPGSYRQFLDMATLKEETEVVAAADMVQHLIDANEAISRQMHETVESAEKVGDSVTADMLTARIGSHEKHAWMLRALVG
ncbi:MAG: Dps family protein [Acetobacterales bacterium]